MKKILALAILAAGLTVAPGPNVVSASSGCSNVVSDWNGAHWTTGSAVCDELAPANPATGQGPEWVRTRIICNPATMEVHYGPKIYTAGVWSTYHCTAGYVWSITRETGFG